MDEIKIAKQHLKNLQDMSMLYSKIVESIFDKEILFEEDTHKKFAVFIHNVINRAMKKGLYWDYYNLGLKLQEFSSRVLSHRFTDRQLDIFDKIDQLNLQKEDITDYYQEIDDISHSKTKKTNSIDSKIERLNKLWDIEPLPENWEEHLEELNEIPPNPIKAKEYIRNLLSKLGQAYESFVLFSTFLFIIFQKIHDQTDLKIEKDFLEGRKLNINKLYRINESQKSTLLLNDFISTDYPKSELILEIFDWVFAINSIREIRNIVIHNLDEKGKCEIESDHILIYFDENPTMYTYNQIADIFHQLQLFIYLIMYISIDMFLLMFSHFYSKEIEKAENEKS